MMDTLLNHFDETAQAEIIRQLIDKLRDYYIFPDLAVQIGEILQKHLEDGDYADFSKGRFFAYALTVHMQEVSQDEHLWVRWHKEPLPDEAESLRLNEDWMAELQQNAIEQNYGFQRVERLPGNVGYIDIRCFHKAEWGGDTATAAMSFLADTRALIFDLRYCTGGHPSMVTHIASYLFGDDSVHLNSIYWRDDDITQQYWTLPYLPGRRLGDKPVYVLTSEKTFSAGEEFAYDLQIRKRATIVGGKTGGGAHPGASYRLHDHFEAFIPVGRAINPITNDNWEGRGVIPDVVIASEKAFESAYHMALTAIIKDCAGSSGRSGSRIFAEAKTALEDLESR